ncbi:MAG: PRC-barrel domain-containing protein [Candidatus Aenigmarchaeota archaeon]|nr:PRC-barrel domain-containing protein [Candidatus Aenigmarchaeota archaeon]
MDAMCKDLIGKVIVSEETGRKFGLIGDINFIIESGELLNIKIEAPTKIVEQMNFETDDRGNFIIPFSTVKSVGDFVIVSEKEIL